MARGELRAVGVALLLLSATFFGAAFALADDRQAPLLQLTVDRAQDVRAVWSPDGKRIAFQSDRGGDQYQIWSMQSDGGDPRQLSHDESDDRHPVYSPDGQQIAFDSGTANRREIWLMNSDGSGRRQITQLDAFASFPSWNTDGTRLAFYLYKAGVTDLYVVNTNGASVQELTKGLADERKSNCTNSCHRPAWSPDNSTIAISGGDHRTIWTVDVGTMAMTQITDGTEHNHFPWYLPDGRLAWVVEYIQQGGAAFTDVVAADPNNPTQSQKLLSNVSVQGPYELSPDGQRVLFHSPRSGNFDIYVADTAAPGGLDALQTSRSTADIGSGVPTPVPEPPAASSRSVAAVDPSGNANALQPVAQQPVAGAAQATPEPPPNPLQTMGITVLLMLGAATIIVTGVQLTRRRRTRR